MQLAEVRAVTSHQIDNRKHLLGQWEREMLGQPEIGFEMLRANGKLTRNANVGYKGWWLLGIITIELSLLQGNRRIAWVGQLVEVVQRCQSIWIASICLVQVHTLKLVGHHLFFNAHQRFERKSIALCCLNTFLVFFSQMFSTRFANPFDIVGNVDFAFKPVDILHFVLTESVDTWFCSTIKIDIKNKSKLKLTARRRLSLCQCKTWWLDL